MKTTGAKLEMPKKVQVKSNFYFGALDQETCHLFG